MTPTHKPQQESSPKAKQRSGARPFTRFKTALMAGCVLLVVLGVSLGVYLNSNLFQTHVLARINTLIPGTLGWKQLDISLLRGRLSARDLVLSSPDGKPVARIAGLDITADWTGLTAGTLRFPLIKLTEPHLILDLPHGGRDNLTASLVAASDTDSSGSAESNSGVPTGRTTGRTTGLAIGPIMELVIEKAIIEKGRLDLTVHHDDPNRQAPAHLNPLNLLQDC